jgi:hypothetical protein
MKTQVWIPVFLALAIPGATIADTLKVPSTNFPTIASAVIAANSGDTIQISPNNANGSEGVYSEVIVVPNTKKGLHFKGSNVIWDGGIANDILTFTGPNDDVTVEGFIFRNGNAQLKLTGDGATVTKCQFVGLLSGASIVIFGNNAKVTETTIRSSTGQGLVVQGTDPIVDKCSFESTRFEAVRGAFADRMIVSNCKFSKCGFGIFEDTSDDVTILKNRFEDIEGNALLVVGNRAVVDGNKILFVGQFAIRVAGDDARVSGNTVVGCPLTGVSLMGAHATVSKNKISNAGGGIEVTLGSSASLGGPTITTNTIKTCFISNGIRVEADTATIVGNSVERILSGAGISLGLLGITPQGGTISKNKIVNVEQQGVLVICSSVEISQNSISEAGNGNNAGSGCSIVGNDCTLIGNFASKISGDGYFISGNTNSIQDCVASSCVRDGFDIDTGNGNSLDGCKANSCGGEGFDNSAGATATSVANCSFSKCRIDFAGNGTLAQDLNNTFKTGGPATAPQID